MPDAEPQKLSLLAKLVVASILVMIVAGIAWHGVSIPTFSASGTTSSRGRTSR
jgi:hypothetical protein